MLMKRLMVRIVFVIAVAVAAAATLVPPAVRAQGAEKAKHGESVYTAQKCGICHAIAGRGSKANPLDGVGTKLSGDVIREWIVSPAQMTAKAKSTKKPPMPDKYSKLPAADLDGLVAYLQTLK